MFDISTLALAPDYTLHLRHPVSGDKLYADKEETKPVEVLLFGTASKQYRNAVSAMQTRQLRRNAKKEKPSAEVMNDEAVDLLVACTSGVNNLAVDASGKVPTTAEDFRKLYADPKFSWLRAQVDEALGEVSNFLKE